MILTVTMEGISKAAAVLSVLMKVRTICCHDRGYINVVLVLQSCSDPLHILPGSSSGTNAASSDCACHIGNVKVEEEEEVNVKTEKGIDSDEEEGVGIKDEEGIYSEEEVEEKDMDIKEEEDAGIKEEVSLEGTV